MKKEFLKVFVLATVLLMSVSVIMAHEPSLNVGKISLSDKKVCQGKQVKLSVPVEARDVFGQARVKVYVDNNLIGTHTFETDEGDPVIEDSIDTSMLYPGTHGVRVLLGALGESEYSTTSLQVKKPVKLHDFAIEKPEFSKYMVYRGEGSDERIKVDATIVVSGTDYVRQGLKLTLYLYEKQNREGMPILKQSHFLSVSNGEYTVTSLDFIAGNLGPGRYYAFVKGELKDPVCGTVKTVWSPGAVFEVRENPDKLVEIVKETVVEKPTEKISSATTENDNKVKESGFSLPVSENALWMYIGITVIGIISILATRKFSVNNENKPEMF